MTRKCSHVNQSGRSAEYELIIDGDTTVPGGLHLDKKTRAYWCRICGRLRFNTGRMLYPERTVKRRSVANV